MLSRTADHLFWMSRYMERAENTARMLNVSYETSLLPQSAAAVEAGWEGILSISELLPAYLSLYKNINPRDCDGLHGQGRGQPLVHHLVLACRP